MGRMSKWIVVVSSIFISVSTVADEYIKVPAENLVQMELSTGSVLIQLMPDIAPKHVAQFKRLIKEGKYDDTSFYRVIEGFVAQGGLEGDESVASLPIESEINYSPEQFTAIQSPDLFAPVTGFYKGFPAAADPENNALWLTHCLGSIAMARGNEPDSATSDFYIVIGQAPRYLDRIMTVFGRVVAGFDHVQQIQRGKSSENGMIAEKENRTLIKNVRLVSDLPENQQTLVEALKTSGEVFSEKIESRKHRSHAFFFKKPPPVLDVCQMPLPMKIDGQLN